MSLTVERIAEGLWQWSLAGASGTYAESPAAILLIDPPLPIEESPDAGRFWFHLDRDIARTRRPVCVLATRSQNLRSADRFVARYGAPLWSPSRADGTIPGSSVHTIWPAGAPGSVAAFSLPTHRALVIDRPWEGLDKLVSELEIVHVLIAHAASALGDSTQD